MAGRRSARYGRGTRSSEEGVLTVDTSNVRSGQRIAAIAGIVLFIVMWFSWYGVDLDKVTGGQGIANLGIDTTANAWQSFSWIDLLMLLTAIVAVGAAALAATGRMS